MNLKDLLDGFDYQLIQGDLNLDIENIILDSRKFVSGKDLFVAERGHRVDGHDFIDDLAEKGLKAVIVEKDFKTYRDINIIKVKDSKIALAYLLSRLNTGIFEKIHNIGITGTNGKTSTSYLLKEIFKNKYKIGIIGTIGAEIDGNEIILENTTPTTDVIYDLLNKMLDKKVNYNFMETSSHGLELARVKYMDFETGIFTNISKDHLDFHDNFENYYDAKKKLFDMTSKWNIINTDDKYGKRLAEEINNEKTITYGINTGDFRAENINYSLTGVKFDFTHNEESIEIDLNIPGIFSVYNALAAATCAYKYGFTLEEIKYGLHNANQVKGRFELVDIDEDYSVIIDFAHTAEGLEQVLKVMNDFIEGKIITVFGAGGDRDRTKRPEMGAVVGKLSDIAVVTSDNPRTEDPEKIIKDVVKGVESENGKYYTFVNRKEAIHFALDIAQAGDGILLAGKGHETYVILGQEKHHFDEREVVIDYLKRHRGK